MGMDKAERSGCSMVGGDEEEDSDLVVVPIALAALS
jgi:hypothetical protein